MALVRLRSWVPGRGRWEIDALRKDPRRSAELELRLRQRTEIRDVSASPVTGRLLVSFDPALQRTEIESLIRSMVSDRRWPVAAPRKRLSLPRPSRAESFLLTGGLLALAPLFIGPSFLVPAVLGAAAVAAVASALRRGRKPPALTPRRHPAIRLYRYARPHRRTILLASALSVAKKVFELVPPVLIGLALDLVVNPRSVLVTMLGASGVSAPFVLLGGLTLAAFALESLAEFGYKLLWRNLGQTIQHELRLDAYDHVQRLQLSHLEDERTGSAALSINTNINQLEHFMNDEMNVLVEVATNTAAILVLFALLVPGIGLIALAPMPILAWAALRYQRSVGPLYAEIEEQSAALTSHVANSLTGVTAIRSYTAEEHVSRRISEASGRYLDFSRRANRSFSAFDPAMRLPILAGFTVVLVAGGVMVVGGSLSVGMYALLLFLIQRLIFPFGYLGQTVNRYQKTMKAIDRVFTVLDLDEERPGGHQALPAASVRGEIVFDSVVLEYEPGSPVLRGFTLAIPAGQRLGIVGSTGAGKTSLVKLLLRFYEPGGGRILLDGIDIRKYAVRDLRRAISFVPQEAILFDESLRDNIAYGDFDATPAEIEACARVAEADAFIARLPRGYDSLVGEMGVKLSGGERQRISIARAVLKNAPIFVLDEATSAVDLDTEAAIQRSLARISSQRTVIVIAHRLSTVRNADRIVVMENGRIVEEGRHEELLARNGVYARLWRVQTSDSTAG